MRVGFAAMSVAVAMTLAAGCAPPDDVSARIEADGATVGSPTKGPALFGFGRVADESLITRWDRDVGPDGVGLPEGRGTAADGAVVYLTRCAACHGLTGTEGPYDILVGGDAWGDGAAPRPRTLGNYWPYATTLFDYITRAMPQNAPGSLTADETYAVIAWLLARNGVVVEGDEMNAATLPAVVMPARDRFVPDNRRGGSEVR